MVLLFFIVELITMLHTPYNNYAQPSRIGFQEKIPENQTFPEIKCFRLVHIIAFKEKNVSHVFVRFYCFSKLQQCTWLMLAGSEEKLKKPREMILKQNDGLVLLVYNYVIV